MPSHVDTEHDASVSTLVGGIIEDARHLFVEQMNLFRVEFKNDMRRAGLAMIPLALGQVVMFTAFILLGMGAAEFASWAFTDLPMWASYLSVGGMVAVLGILLTLWGKSLLAAVKPIDTALKGLEENVTWKTKN